MIVVLLVKNGQGSSLDLSDVTGFRLGSGQMDWVWLWLGMLDMMVSETWRVPSKLSGCFLLNHVNAYSLNIALHVICSQHFQSTNHKCTHVFFTFQTDYVVQETVKMMWDILVTSSSSRSS
jgi:hypothetical protein